MIMFTSPHEFGLCTHHVSYSTDVGLVGCSRKVPHFIQKNPPAEISAYGPVKSVCSNPVLATKPIIIWYQQLSLKSIDSLNPLELKMKNRGITWTGKRICDWVLEL